MKTHVVSLLASTGLLLHAQVAPEDASWPRSYAVDGAEVVLYEPQVEKWQGSSLDARFAAGIKLKGADEVVYGSFAAHADALANSETRTVTLYNFSATELKFPDAADKLPEFTRIIGALAPEKPLKVPLDSLLAAVPSDDVITRTTVTTPAQTKAPKIIVRFENTVLVPFDGKPAFRGIPGTGLEAAVNTPATLLRPQNGGPLYLLTNEGLWLQAAGWAGPWQAASSAPNGLDRIAPDHPVAQALKNAWREPGADAGIPEVVTSETPTELIQIDGKPNYDRIGDLPLVRVKNTDSPLFYHFDRGLFYVLISGRWFTSAELTGPWTYIAHNELPAEFAQIPADDPSADVRASIAGTREAEEAAKEAQIPTYARVNLGETPEIRVEYDGDPVFEDVSGGGVAYAVNTTSAVLCVGGRYYCCQDGLWFVADRPFGSPWRCATVLPPEIYGLPPSCPLYHTRFCEVDSFADDWVVYRCTPGYWGTYLDPLSHVCVYGTGWWYPAYVSRDYYCGHAWTYGLGCRYVPRCGFVRKCDRVVHTGWFRHTGRGSTLWRADSERWGGRFEREHWRWSGGRTPAYSSWNNRVATHSAEVIRSIRHHGPENPAVSRQTEGKPLVVSRGHATAVSSTQFDRDVRPGRHGEVYRRGADGWQRRESGQWRLPDKEHPVDPRVAASRGPRDSAKEKPQAAPIQGLSRDHRNTPIPAQALNTEKVRAPHETPHRETEPRSGQPTHLLQKKSPEMPKNDSRAEHGARRIDAPPSRPVQHEEKKEPPKIRIEQHPPSPVHREPAPEPRHVERRDIPRVAPKVEPREAPRIWPNIEHRGAPPQTQRVERHDPPPQMHRETPRRVEQPKPQPQMLRETPRQVEQPKPQPQVHREAPRHVEQPRPQPQVHREAPRHVEQPRPQPQVHREAPRRMEQAQPRQDRGPSSNHTRSQQSDGKKEDKKR